MIYARKVFVIAITDLKVSLAELVLGISIFLKLSIG